MIYRYHKPSGKCVTLDEWHGLEAQTESKRSHLASPNIIADISPYISPLSDPAKGPGGRIIINSRSERTAELKQHGLREVAPDEKAAFCGEASLGDNRKIGPQKGKSL